MYAGVFMSLHLVNAGPHVSIIQTADMMVLSTHQVCRPLVSVLEINLRNYSSWAIKYFGPWILDKEAHIMSRKDLIYTLWGYGLCTL